LVEEFGSELNLCDSQCSQCVDEDDCRSPIPVTKEQTSEAKPVVRQQTPKKLPTPKREKSPAAKLSQSSLDIAKFEDFKHDHQKSSSHFSEADKDDLQSQPSAL